MMQGWERKAACAPQNRSKAAKDLDWFSTDPDEKYTCRAVCMSECSVRKWCVQTALTNKYIHGVWGGVDEYEIRRALSVDANGDPSDRDRAPRCPFCLSKNLDIASQKNAQGYYTQCLNKDADGVICGVSWYMATVPNKIKDQRKTKKRRNAA